MKKTVKIIITALVLLALVTPASAASTVKHYGGGYYGLPAEINHEITKVISVSEVEATSQSLAACGVEESTFTSQGIWVNGEFGPYVPSFENILVMVESAQGHNKVKEYTVEVGATITLGAPQLQQFISTDSIVDFDVIYETLYIEQQTWINGESQKPTKEKPENPWMLAEGTKLTINEPSRFVIIGTDAGYSVGGGYNNQIPDIYFVEAVAKSITPTPGTEAPSKVDAKPTSAKVLVNGKAVVFEAYNINDNNYFKLRDLAQAVNNTNKNFEVSWDGAKNAINLVSSTPYTVAGGELTKGDGKAKVGNKTTSTIYKDGVAIAPLGYNINDNNFFKLRDLAQLFDIGITWDGNTNTIGIDTSISYVAP